MKPSRIVALVVGCLLLLPGIALLFGGGVLGIAYAAGRNESGYFQATLTDLHTATSAITAETPVLTADLQPAAWMIDALDTDLRLRVTATDSDAQTFVGIGPAADLDAYLAGVASDSITGLTTGTGTGTGTGNANGTSPIYQTTPGGSPALPPTEQAFWAASTSGSGPQELSWHPTDGRWAIVIMNADGSPGIATGATVEIRAGFVLPLALTLLILGTLVTAGSIVLIIVGAAGRPNGKQDQAWPAAIGTGIAGAHPASSDHPVVLTAQLDPGLSRWKWLVKWFLAIPHFFLLAFLWPAGVLVTIVAGFCILFTGRYPRALFDFTSGVLRWTWRVSYYALSGGIGTDRYPPFTLGIAPGYPATLDIAYPATLSRGLVLVKWWLLAIPQYFIVGLMIGNWFGWTTLGRDVPLLGPIGGAGILGLLVVIAGCILLFTGRYPLPLFGLVIGMNRWIYRVAAYATLMTDKYPPFRLEQGGAESAESTGSPSAGPAGPTLPEPATTRTG